VCSGSKNVQARNSATNSDFSGITCALDTEALGEQPARCPRGAAALQCGASYRAKYVREIAFDQRLALSTEREPAYANIVQQAHDVVVTGAHANDAISDAMNLNHTLDYRLHCFFPLEQAPRQPTP